MAREPASDQATSVIARETVSQTAAGQKSLLCGIGPFLVVESRAGQYSSGKDAHEQPDLEHSARDIFNGSSLPQADAQGAYAPWDRSPSAGE